MPARLTSRAYASRAALVLLASGIVACGEAPPKPPKPPEPPPRSWVGLVEPTAEEEAVILGRMQQLLPPLVKRVFGLPPATARWSAPVYVDALIDRLPTQCFDTTVAPTARERARFNFCHGVEAALGPTDSARAPGDMHRRTVTVGHLMSRDDTLFVNVELAAERLCPDGKSGRSRASYQYHFVRQGGAAWRLANEHPPMFDGGDAPGASCYPEAPGRTWFREGDPWPPPPEPGSASTLGLPDEGTASALPAPDR